MRFSKYIIDRKYAILGFLVIMLFISAVIYLDGSVKVSPENILYINIVSLFLFVIYLIIRYMYKRDYYRELHYIIQNERDEIINRLPMPKSYEQMLFHQLLGLLNNEKESRISRLYEQNKAHEEYIASWVHQIKPPIAVSRLLIENNMNNPSKETLYSIEEELDKIENYIEEVLYHSKIDDFSRDYLINEVELEGLVKEAVKKQAKTFINKKISIEIENTGLSVLTDPKWLSFILGQLLSNALKYTSQGGKIKIYARVEDKCQRLFIEDSGIGIRPEDIERVFDKGFTGFNGREGFNSTGIGLYLSKKLAQKLGHDIAVESSYGEYTRVSIIFPASPDYLQV